MFQLDFKISQDGEVYCKSMQPRADFFGVWSQV